MKAVCPGTGREVDLTRDEEEIISQRLDVF